MKKQTKTSLVLSHLNKVGAITSWEAIELYGATRLSAIIWILRHKRNLNIRTHSVEFTDRFGNKGTYAKYQLVK